MPNGSVRALLLGGPLFVVLSAGVELHAQPAAAEDAFRVPRAQYTGRGAEGCRGCHAGAISEVMAETAHGDASNPHSPYAQQACESCHGPGSLHVSRAQGGVGHPPLVRFGRGGDPAPVQLEACLDCHGRDLGEQPAMEWTGSLHDTGRMTCSTCHETHTNVAALADAAQQAVKCGTCHQAQIDGHARFEGSAIVFDRLTCSTCHDPHQLVRRES